MFDNREINFKINNEIKESIEAKVKIILILRIFILNFNNSILIFKKIVEIVRVVYQSTSVKKEKKLNLKKQFNNVCQQNESF